MKRAVPAVVLLAALGCQTLPPTTKTIPGPQAAVGAPRTQASGTTGPFATLQPSNGSPLPRPSGVTPSAGAATDRGTPAPPRPAGATTLLPTRVIPPLPASLRAVAGLVGADGASLVGADGGTMVAAGGLNYMVLQAKPAPLSEMIRGQLQIYLVTTAVIEAILRAAAVASLQAGATLTFPDNDNPDLTAEEKQRPENHLTVRLREAADHAVVEIFRGPAPDPQRQVAGVSFSSPTRGRALLRDLGPKKDGTQTWVATSFDLDAGSSSADLYVEGPTTARSRLHITFAAAPGAGPGQPTFRVRTAGYGKNPAKKDDGVLELSINFRDEGAAAIVGFLPAEFKAMLGESLVFLPSDGSEPNPANTAPHAYFLDDRGRDVAAASAPAALVAIVPADTDVQKPFMTDPTVPADRAPLQETIFKFPE